MKKSIICSILFFFFIAAAPGTAQENLLGDVREKFNKASTISADIAQKTGNSSLNGKIYIKKENKLRIEFRNNTIISDGSTIWNYNKKENKVIINTFDENDPSAWSFDKIINEYPEKSEVSQIEDNGRDVLILKPGINSGLNFNSVRLWVNKENLVEKVMIEQSGSSLEIAVSNYMLNRDIPDSRFTFSPPEGTQVIDLR